MKPPSALRLEALDDLAHNPPLLAELEEGVDEPRRPHAAQHGVTLQKQRPRPFAAGRKGRADAGRSAAHDEHVRLRHDRQPPGGFAHGITVFIN